MISGGARAAAKLLGMPISASPPGHRPGRRAGRAPRHAAMTYDDLPGGADIVIVSTPPADHAADALRAARSGRGVVLEKPLCTHARRGRRLVAAAAAHAERLLYAENLAYAPVVQTCCVRALISARHPSGGPHAPDAADMGRLHDRRMGWRRALRPRCAPARRAVLLARPATAVGVRCACAAAPGTAPTSTPRSN